MINSPNKSQDSHSIFLLEVKSSQVYKNKLGLIDKHSVGSDVERGGGLHVCVSFRHSVNFYDYAEERVLYKEFQCCKSLLPLLQSTPDLVLLLPEVIDTMSQW